MNRICMTKMRNNDENPCFFHNLDFLPQSWASIMAAMFVRLVQFSKLCAWKKLDTCAIYFNVILLQSGYGKWVKNRKTFQKNFCHFGVRLQLGFPILSHYK